MADKKTPAAGGFGAGAVVGDPATCGSRPYYRPAAAAAKEMLPVVGQPGDSMDRDGVHFRFFVQKWPLLPRTPEERDSVVWYFFNNYTNDPIVCRARDLYRYRRFRERVMVDIGVRLAPLTDDEWCALLNEGLAAVKAAKDRVRAMGRNAPAEPPRAILYLSSGRRPWRLDVVTAGRRRGAWRGATREEAMAHARERGWTVEDKMRGWPL